MMFVSDSVGGADARRNGFSNRMPVNVDRKIGAHGDLPREENESLA